MSAAALLEPPAVDAAAFAQQTGATPAQLSDLERYRDLLVEWNARLNLVSPTSLAEFWSRHAFDSAQLVALAPDSTTWVDIGAGAGFPGLVLAILLKERPGACVHLVESIAKKGRFLAAAVDALDLPATVHVARAEHLALRADVVTARAVAPLERLLAYARPYLQRGAVGLFLKGRRVAEELAEARRKWRFAAEVLPSRSDPEGRIVRVERLARVR